MLRPANMSTHSRGAATIPGNGPALSFLEPSSDRVLLSVFRLIRRNAWEAFKILLVFLTTLFFLFQTECKHVRLTGKSSSGACTFVLSKLQASQPDPVARFSAER